MIRVRLLLSIIALSFVLIVAGCAKKAPAAAPPPPPPPPAAPPPPAPTPAPLTEEELFARKSVDQLNAEKPLTDVFFELDRADVRDDSRPALQKNADFLKRWSSVQVTVEGHADAR